MKVTAEGYWGAQEHLAEQQAAEDEAFYEWALGQQEENQEWLQEFLREQEDNWLEFCEKKAKEEMQSDLGEMN